MAGYAAVLLAFVFGGIAVTLFFVSRATLQRFETAKAGLLDQFKLLSAEALKSNHEEFLKRAGETLKAQQDLAKQDLEAKGTSIKEVLEPLKESVAFYNERLSKMEAERAEREGRFAQQLSDLVALNQNLQKETSNLVHALKRPEVRGHWGEIQLRRVVELAGMSEHCDFATQESVSTDHGRYRPDLVVKLPGERVIIVDAKAVLAAYLEALEATSDDARRAAFLAHARQVRDQVNLLASKAYADCFEHSLDFVVCFLPGEAFLYAACEADRELVEYAMKKNVILATPSTLMALLKAVAFGWRQETIAKNAKVIGEHATELIERLAVALEHLHGHGEQMSKSIESYNRFVGSIERKVVPQAERMLDLGVAVKKEVPHLAPVEVIPRAYVPERLLVLQK